MNPMAFVSTLVFLLVGLTQLTLMFGVRLNVVDHLLRQGTPAYLAVAIFCWLVVLTGLATETWRGPLWANVTARGQASTRISRVLDRVTGQALLHGRALPIDGPALVRGLKAGVAGQDAACEDVAEQLAIRAARVGGVRPLGVFLFVGPPGCGKTHFAKCLAELGRRNLLHLDMAQYSELHAASQMFGVPPGYIGSSHRGRLIAALSDHPDTVVLLDEVEKAHPDILRKFLVAWNEGTVSDASTGRLVSCAKAIFVLTSNAGAEILSTLALEHAEDPNAFRSHAIAVLRLERFAPEVLDRIDRIVVFRPLGEAAIMHLAVLEAGALIRAYAMEPAGPIDPALFTTLLQRPYRSGTLRSSRDVIRLLESLIGSQLAAARSAGVTRVRLVAQPDGLAALAA